MSSPLSLLSNPNTITADGETVTAAVWDNNFSSIVNYINSSLTASFNVVQGKGDIYVYDGSNIQALSASGVTDGWVLSKNSTAPFGAQWISPPGLPTTTNGDTIYYNSGANQRLPVGTPAQVLTVSSGGLPSWMNAAGVASGIIALWSGTIATIPTGWVICDGNNGTPNLQGLFVVGAGASSPPAVGGMGLLNPGGPNGDTSSGAGVGAIYTSGAASLQTVAGNGSSAAASNLATFPVGPVTPRYYSLCYVMKL
jgi:hypothetical protein